MTAALRPPAKPPAERRLERLEQATERAGAEAAAAAQRRRLRATDAQERGTTRRSRTRPQRP